MSKQKQIRDRIKELRRVRAGDLYASPKNWRTHPQAQVDAMQGILREIGYAGALLARELPDGTMELIDGHLRKELDPEQMVPVLVLDVTEEEADKLLATYDPLSAMAETDKDALGRLLLHVQSEDDAVQALLAGLAEENGVNIYADGGELPDIEETTRHTVVVPYDDADIPAIKKFLRVDEFPLALGKAICERIKELSAN